MSAQELAIVIGAVAAGVSVILGAIGALWAKVHTYQGQVDGRMTELLALTKTSATAQGRAESPRKYPPDWTK